MPEPRSEQPQPIYVKPSTAAVMVECTRQHIYELVARGQLTRYNVGGLSRISVAELVELFESGAVNPRSEAS